MPISYSRALGALASLCAIACATPSMAQAHVHGTSTMMLVVAGPTVEITIEMPASDIVGFERPPATDAEHELIATAIETLSDPLALFPLAPDAGCTLQSADVDFPFAAHEDHHDHDHDHEASAHSEFTANYALACPTLATSGVTLQTSFFEAFPAAHAITLEGLIDGAALRATLTPDAPSASLR